MANICKYFILFLLFSLILKPEINTVEARLQLKKLGRQWNVTNSFLLKKVKPESSGPSSGIGNGRVKKCKKTLEVANSGPSPGEGHKRVPARPSVNMIKP
ncbi:hypothetical protein ACS0TY_001853 [Phlomoides rotata]